MSELSAQRLISMYTSLLAPESGVGCIMCIRSLEYHVNLYDHLEIRSNNILVQSDYHQIWHRRKDMVPENLGPYQVRLVNR